MSILPRRPIAFEVTIGCRVKLHPGTFFGTAQVDDVGTTRLRQGVRWHSPGTSVGVSRPQPFERLSDWRALESLKYHLPRSRLPFNSVPRSHAADE